MARYEFRLPDVGEGVAEAEITAWHVAVGDVIAEDQRLADVMTDKATVEIESPVAGRVVSLAAAVGDTIAIGSTLVVLETDAAEAAVPASEPDPAQSAPVTGRYEFRLPDVGEGVAEAEIVAWHVAVGDMVAEDQQIADVMTDKATVEIESPVAGRVLSLGGNVGDRIAVGTTLVTFETAGETVPASAARVADKPTPQPASSSGQEAPTPQERSARTGHASASPAVRKRARDLNIDLDAVPSGGDHITHADLDSYLLQREGGMASRSVPVSAPPTDPRDEQVPLVGLRRKIAEAMAESKRRIPHAYYAEEVDMTSLEALRAKLNAEREDRLTPLPFLIAAMCRAITDYPQINATFSDDSGIITRHASIHMGVATQTDGGLMVPVIRDAQDRDLAGIASEVARLAEGARSGTLGRDELSGSSITISSLGSLGGIVSGPVINRPEVFIIAVNKLVERVVPIAGQPAIRKMMNLSSSFDHRAVDGWDAAHFINRMKSLLENPQTLL